MLSESLLENPNNRISDGGIFKKGFDQKLDELKGIEKNAISYIEDFERREIKSTGIIKSVSYTHLRAHET